MPDLTAFLTESLAIEGVHRSPSPEEFGASAAFMDEQRIDIERISALQAVFTPGAPLRDKSGMDVQVGRHVPPAGGMSVRGALGNLAFRVDRGGDPWGLHVEFQRLHPFLDGNGRTGRLLWAWNMRRTMQDPFRRAFLHAWYYQTLQANDRIL